MVLRASTLLCLFLLEKFLTSSVVIAQPSRSPLNPQDFVTLQWDGRIIAKPGERPWEVIGGRGTLSISLDLHEMKQQWQVDTAGSLSMRGHVRNATGGERVIEVPGYSMVGEQETVFDLDMYSARGLVDTLFQGSSFAHRILGYNEEAQLARTLAEIDVYDERIRQYLQYLEMSEAALRGIYTQTLGFTLTYDQIRDGARALEEAERQLGDFEADLRSARAVESMHFIESLETDAATLRGYLGMINALPNRPHLEILGGIIGKGGDVISSTAVDIENSLNQLNGPGLTDADRARIKARFVHIAKLLQELERDLFYKYRDVGTDRRKSLEEAPQYRRHMPKGPTGGPFEIPQLEYTLERVSCASSNTMYEETCQRRLNLMTPEMPPLLVDDYVRQRVESIRAMVQQIAGTGRYPEVEGEIERKFRKQIEPLTREPAQLEAARDTLIKRFVEDCACTAAKKAFVALPENAEKITRNNEAVRVLLMIDAIGALIDRIRPTSISLDELSLKNGDQLAIIVSFIPRASDGSPPPPQLPYTFEVQPWGFSGIAPTVRDTLYVVKPDKGENFAVAPAVAILWNFYGGGPRVKTFWRTVAPGVGFTTTFLNFDKDDTTIEFGIGPSFTAFNNILHLSFGWNLSARASNASGASRAYFSVGVSLTEIEQRLTKPKSE